MTVRRKDLAYWDIRVDNWTVEGGTYLVEVGASSRDIRASAAVEITGDSVVLPLSRNSTIGEVLAHPVAGPKLHAAMAQMMDENSNGAAIMPEGVDISRMIDSFPIGRAGMFAAGSGADVGGLIDDLLAT
jgi:beta-glucosidase